MPEPHCGSMSRSASFLLAAAASIALAASPAAAAGFSGALTATSDYVFRGVSQTAEDPALQAGLKLVVGRGLYGSLWASNVDYGEVLGTDAELDIVVGWSGSLTSKLVLDLNLTRYTYPGTEEPFDLDYNELVGTLSWTSGGWLLVGYSDDVFASAHPGTYLQIGARFPLGRALRLETAGGFYVLEHLEAESYSHAQASLIYGWKRLELRASAHFTDGNAEEIFGKKLTGTSAEVAVSASF